jgi:hypothetical protein
LAVANDQREKIVGGLRPTLSLTTEKMKIGWMSNE